MIAIAKKEHLPQIDYIYNQAVKDGLRTAHLHPLSEEERFKWFERHNPEKFPIFVRLDNYQKVRGWLSVSPYRSGRDALSEVAEISYYVDYTEHGKGIATELMQYGIEYCKSTSFRILVAILISGNEESMGLLEKFGFQESGRIKKAVHYRDMYRDHVYMSLNIE